VKTNNSFVQILGMTAVVAIIAATPPPVVAQTSIYTLVPTEGRISIGEEVRSALSSSDATRDNGAPLEVWDFRGRAGDVITIDLISDDFDAYLLLVGPGFDDPLTNDDGGDGLNSQITATLLENAEYKIVATALSSGATGGYSLYVSEGSMSAYPGGSAQNAAQFADNADYISIGETVSSVLASNDPIVRDDRRGQGWILNGIPGETVVIDLESDEFDTYLFVTGPGIADYDTDDDGGNGSDSQLTLNFTSSGEYLIIASAFSSSGSGAYTLTVTPQETGSVQEIEIGEIRSGVLASNSPNMHDGRIGQRWEFYGEAGQTVSITMRSEEFDTYLYLSGPGLSERLEDDDGAGSLDSRIDFTVPQSGIFNITASALSGDGGYTLEVLGRGRAETHGRLRVGRTETEWLEANAPHIYDDMPGHRWTFNGERGDRVVITMRSEEFDTYLFLSGPGLDSRLSDDDSAGDLDSRITFTVPQSGEYEIVAAALSGSGSYTLEASLSGEMSTTGRIRAGDTESGYLTSDAEIYDTRPAQIWEYRAREGETVTFELYSDEFDTFLYIEGPGLRPALSDDDSGEGNGSRLTVSFPENGTYRIVAAMFSSSSGGGEYSISAIRR